MAEDGGACVVVAVGAGAVADAGSVEADEASEEAVAPWPGEDGADFDGIILGGGGLGECTELGSRGGGGRAALVGRAALELAPLGVGGGGWGRRGRRGRREGDEEDAELDVGGGWLVNGPEVDGDDALPALEQFGPLMLEVLPEEESVAGGGGHLGSEGCSVDVDESFTTLDNVVAAAPLHREADYKRELRY